MRFVSVLAFSLVALGCSAFLKEGRPWSFVTAVGGLELGSPVRVDGHWELPVRADVSGLHAITHEPTTMNSGLVCDSTKAKVEGHDIRLLIVTTVPHGKATSRCPPANLGALSPGQYHVAYGASHDEQTPLGSIDVALNPTVGRQE